MRTKIYLLLIALLTTIGSVWGQDFEVNGLWYRELTATTVTVVMPDTVKYGKYSGDVVLPATVTSEGNTYDVTEIGNAFRRCHELTSITIEGDKLERINDQAFYHCYKLKTITIPKSVTFIQSSFTDYCVALESIVVAAGNTVYGNYNDDGVLYDLTTNRLVRYPPARSETTFTIPAFVVRIEAGAFIESNLPSITIPSTVDLATGALRSTYIQSIIVDPGHTQFVGIDGVLFSKDEKTLIQFPGGKVLPGGIYNLPEQVTTLGFGAFAESFLLREVHLSDKITALPSQAFRFCTALERVTGLEEVLSIGNQAFDNCHALQHFELPKKLTSIGVAAFLDCESLSGNIEIPKGVTTIGRAAFGGCLGVESFSVEAGNTDFGVDEAGALFTTAAPKRLVQYPPANELDSYSLPDDIEEISEGAFRGASIGELILSEVTTIGVRAFQDSEIGLLVFDSDTPPANFEPSSFDRTSENMVIVTKSKDPAVLADYEAQLGGLVGFILSEYVVTLDYNDGITPTRFLGSDPATKKLFVEPVSPSLSGYDFMGWHDENDEKWVSGTIVSSDMILIAHWAVTHPAIVPPVKAMYTVTITPLAGVNVNKSSTTIGEGNSFNFTAESTTPGYSVNVFVNGSPLSAISGITYLIEDIKENKTVTFSLTAGGATPNPDTDPVAPGDGNDNNNNGGGQIVIDENTPSEIPGEFPPTGEIIVYPPVVDPNNPNPSVTIDGEEVPGRWDEDKDGNPIFVIDYEDLEDGEHTLVIGDKEYTFTTNKNAGGATSNDVLSTAKVIAGYGNITIDTPKSAIVQVVSFSGSVVYNASVIGTATVNVPAGIYVVVVDGSVTKVVVR